MKSKILVKLSKKALYCESTIIIKNNLIDSIKYSNKVL